MSNSKSDHLRKSYIPLLYTSLNPGQLSTNDIILSIDRYSN